MAKTKSGSVDVFSLEKMEDCSEEYMMHFEINRFNSYKNWPFAEDCSCNPKDLAAAGFYHIPTNAAPDACRCFFCYKELDGWEPDDNPWGEHRKHSPKCQFLDLKKPIEELVMSEFVKMECERQKNRLAKLISLKKQELDDQAKNVRVEMMRLQDIN